MRRDEDCAFCMLVTQLMKDGEITERDALVISKHLKIEHGLRTYHIQA